MSDLDNEEMKSKSSLAQTPSSKRPKILQRYKRESELNIPIIKSSIETQTEWSWLQDMQLLEKLKEKFDFDTLAPVTIEKSATSRAKSMLNPESELEYELDDDANEDYGSSEPESPLLSPKYDSLVQSVGPPNILKYQPETQKTEISPPSPPISVPFEPIDDLGQFMKDFNVHLDGGQPCEFCYEITKPWPSISSQEITNPEELYCCNEYQEYVDGLIQYQREKEKLRNTDQDFRYVLNASNITSSTNKKTKLLVKERDEFRNMQKLAEKQKRLELITTLKQQQQSQPSQQANSNVNRPVPSQTASRRPMMHESRENREISNQIKSINYQLSNLKYIQEGWTVRQNSFIGFEEYEDDSNFLATFRQNETEVARDLERPLLVKKYKNGHNCLILFSDGSGSCFYPSGRLALSIVLVSPGMHLISAFSDDITPIQIASFDPFGNGSCNFSNGKIRLILSPFGGLELDTDGSKKKKWQWWDPAEHVHAPPFQSLVFTLNNQISIRIYNQDKINIDFLAENQICKFKVGARIKIVKPEAIVPAVTKIDINENYLIKKRNRIEQLFKLLNQSESGSSILKLPKLTNSFTSSRSKISDLTKLAATNLKKSQSQRKQSSKFLTVP